MIDLKHIAPYLPYGLKITFEGDDCTHEVVGLSIASKGVELISPFGDYGRADIEDCKLILRPLSDLTKEIEHNGERFIPIMRIFGGDTYDHDYKYEISIVEKPIVGKRIEISVKGLGSPVISFSVSNILNNPLYYSQWKELIEWHFDINSLIEKGLAIDINELNKL